MKKRQIKFNEMKKFAMDECIEGGVESRIKYLVEVFNTLPGIITTSSCGGHEIVEKPTQSPADGYNIDFFVDVKKGGWHSLELITQVAWITSGEDVIISAWHTPSGHLAFSIEGKNNVSPNKLAACLSRGEQ